MAIGYRGWDRKHPELRGRPAAMSPSMVIGGQNLLECRDTSYTLSPSMGFGRKGQSQLPRIKGHMDFSLY